MYWEPIDSAPKDGRPVIVNDTKAATPRTAGIVLARYASYPDWSGWIYCDEALQDFNPYGPEPTCWLANVPEIPETFLKELRNE